MSLQRFLRELEAVRIDGCIDLADLKQPAEILALLRIEQRDQLEAGVRRRHAKNWSSFGPDGEREFWRACRTGLYVITDRSGELAPAGDFMGVCGVFLEPDGERWSGELFYALALPYHGRGVMREAAAAVISRFRSLPDAGSDIVERADWDALQQLTAETISTISRLR